MSERPVSDTISIRIDVVGRRVVLRNAMIGAAIAAVIGGLISLSSVTIAPFEGLVPVLIGGAAAGIVGALVAWVGQVAARDDTASGLYQRINWRAVAYSGLTGGCIGLMGLVVVVISSVYHNNVGLGLLFTTMAVLIGALIAGGMTLGVSSAINALGGKSSPQMLGEPQFDPLGQHEGLKQQVRR